MKEATSESEESRELGLTMHGDPGVPEVLDWPTARCETRMRQTNEPEQLPNIKGRKILDLRDENEDENEADPKQICSARRVHNKIRAERDPRLIPSSCPGAYLV